MVMAPMMRCRATPEHTPDAMMAMSDAQRATAGLISAHTPGIGEAIGGIKVSTALWHRRQAVSADANAGLKPAALACSQVQLGPAMWQQPLHDGQAQPGAARDRVA
jgi:2,4-dienoyl-CoA reductase-like NADH-dependent reductase (Old Yellow Enzyme family)